MTTIIWSDQSRLDLAEILDHYEAIDAELAARIRRAIIATPDFLLDYPRAGPPVGSGGLRKWRVGKLPLLLLYRVRNNAVEVARLRHMAQS